MNPSLHQEVSRRLKAEFGLVDRGAWLRQGKCPKCSKKELFTNAEHPWVVRCGRANRCGYTAHVKELFGDLFDNWSERFRTTPERPNAAAEAYLLHARRLDPAKLRGAFTQDSFYSNELKIGSSTVRFPLPGGGWWERIIDQPHRFGSQKARFAPGKSYRGEVWMPPMFTDSDLAAASELWIVEGIFDAVSLWHHGILAVSAMSCVNYPEAFLARIAALCTDRARPKLVWAFDGNAAGRRYIKTFADKSRKSGWEATAALTQEHATAKPRDWNDLHLLSSEEEPAYSPQRLEEYRWNGAVLLAGSAIDKAKLIHHRRGWSSFILEYGTRTWRAIVNEARVAELIADMNGDPMTAKLPHERKREIAVDDAMSVREIANCELYPLYFQYDDIAKEGSYYFQVNFPSDLPSIKNSFSAAQVVNAPDFGKRLAALSPAAVWEGETADLTRMRKNWVGIRTVQAVYVTGYVKEHGLYVFPDHAVKDGKVHPINDEDYFEVGKFAVKPTSSERVLDIKWDGGDFRPDWMADWFEAFNGRGIAALAYWFGTLFAEQIRAKQQSWPFLECWGEPGGGKSTIIDLMWRMVGRADYEGFDPRKSTAAARARNLGKVGNLPVVLIESDSDGDDRSHAKQFDWDELKTAYNGRSVRSRGVANGGMETFEPPFRGAIVISQNESVNGSPAIKERICSLQWSKDHHTTRSRQAVERLLARDPDSMSAFIIECVRREPQVMKTFFEAYPRCEAYLQEAGGTRNHRLIKNHAQLMAALEALAPIIGMPEHIREAGDAQIVRMCQERNAAVTGDHPIVQRFWELFEHIQDTSGDEDVLNHSRSPEYIAVRLIEWEARAVGTRLEMPAIADVKKHLKTSKNPKFVACKPVNSRKTGNSVHCWVFQRQPQAKD